MPKVLIVHVHVQVSQGEGTFRYKHSDHNSKPDLKSINSKF